MRFAAFLSLLFLTACAGADPGTGTIVENAGDVSTEPQPGAGGEVVQVEGILGDIRQEDVERAVKKGMKRIERCYMEALDDLEEIEGSFDVSIQVGAQGQVDQVFLKNGDLGSASAQECIERVVEDLVFPAPRGGTEAHVSYPLYLEAPYDNPAPADWSAVVKNHASGPGAEDLARCLEGKKGVRLTCYIGDDGAVLSAGATCGDPELVEAARCLEKAAAGWRMEEAPKAGIGKAVVDF